MADYKHYVRTDSNGYIIKAFSDAFEQPIGTDTFIEEGERHYNLDLYNEQGITKYKYNNGIEALTTTEIEELSKLYPRPLSEAEKLRSDVDYLLMLQGEV